MSCKNCGGTMVESVSSADHCEYADYDEYAFNEADASPTYCDHDVDSEEE